MIAGLEERIALVTGGSSGIGKASAMRFARAGARVIIASRSREKGEETVQEIKNGGGEAVFFRTDVVEEDQIKKLLKQIKETFGKLDFAFNNAGVEGVMAPTTECTQENWNNVLHTGLRGIWLCMKYEIPLMLENNGGAIVNMSSIYGLKGFPGGPAYVANKHGIIGLTKTAAVEYAKANIRVNVVCPSYISTPMTERFIKDNPEIEAQILAQIPMGRMGAAEEVAEVVVWLCSDASSFVTGLVMLVDGGLMAL